jgi:integrase
MYKLADSDMKLVLHCVATTGARINEVLSSNVYIPSSYGKKCWGIKLKEKGKNKQSSRIVPVHSSLEPLVANGFKFNLTYCQVDYRLKKLIEEVVVDKYEEGTGKLRKLSFHSLRSTVITELIAKHRIHSKVVSGVTGHITGNGDGTASYVKTDLNELERTVELIPWINL